MRTTHTALMLQPSCPRPAGTAYARRPDISAEQSAGLAALCAACPSLRSLHLLKWHHLPDGALEALASLTALHTLQVTSNTLHLAAGVLATVAQLPRLRRLGLPCRGLDSTGALTPGRASPGRGAPLMQLPLPRPNPFCPSACL